MKFRIDENVDGDVIIEVSGRERVGGRYGGVRYRVIIGEGEVGKLMQRFWEWMEVEGIGHERAREEV